MANGVPFGRSRDMDFMFTKLQVHDLEKAAAFFTSVFGLIEMHRMDAAIAGRKVTEIVYQPTYEGGPMFILAKFHDRPAASNNELILGFAAKNLEEALERCEQSGGRIVEPIQGSPGGMRHAFVADGEGHLIQISQAS